MAEEAKGIEFMSKRLFEIRQLLDVEEAKRLRAALDEFIAEAEPTKAPPEDEEKKP